MCVINRRNIDIAAVNFLSFPEGIFQRQNIPLVQKQTNKTKTKTKKPITSLYEELFFQLKSSDIFRYFVMIFRLECTLWPDAPVLYKIRDIYVLGLYVFGIIVSAIRSIVIRSIIRSNTLYIHRSESDSTTDSSSTKTQFFVVCSATVR